VADTTVMDPPAPAEAATPLTPALVEADATPTTVIDRPAVEKKRANRRGAEQAEVTAVLVSKKAGRRRRWPWVVLLVVALLGAGGAGAYLLVGEQVPSHPLPDVTQRDRATAEGALKAARFVPVVEERFIDATVPGIVTEQSPKAGTKADGKPTTLKEGKTVTLIVSKGPPPTPIPDLTDLTEAKAKAEIEKVGHVVGDITRPFNETVEAGVVMSWSGKGESPPKGARVDLTVSAGPAPRTVPTLSGRTYEQAVAALEAVQLRVARNPDQYSDDDSTKGKVILASPTQGSTVKRGDVITVTVSAGKPEVPSLNGLTVAEAEAKLATVGLKLDSKFGPSGGKVFLTTPGAGSKVSPGSSVDVFIL
jgi:serine/threonine-protein kinase